MDGFWRDWGDDITFGITLVVGLLGALVALMVSIGVLVMNVDGATCSTYADRNPTLDVRIERWSWATWDCVVDVDGSLIPLDQYRGVVND